MDWNNRFPKGDMMEIKEEISTLSDKQLWKDFFLALSKEELAELLLDRMVKDRSFDRELFYKFSKDTSSVSEVIIEYETAVMEETNLKVADVDFLRIISEKVMRKAVAEANILDRLRLYVSVIKNLDSAISEGAGWENEDEDVLVELIDECRYLMLTVIGEKKVDLQVMDLSQVYDFLKNESDRYQPFDGDNRIEEVLNKIGDQKVLEDCRVPNL